MKDHDNHDNSLITTLTPGAPVAGEAVAPGARTGRSRAWPTGIRGSPENVIADNASSVGVKSMVITGSGRILLGCESEDGLGSDVILFCDGTGPKSLRRQKYLRWLRIGDSAQHRFPLRTLNFVQSNVAIEISLYSQCHIASLSALCLKRPSRIHMRFQVWLSQCYDLMRVFL